MDAGNLLKPKLARGELHCIGATTLDEYRKYIEKDAALERRFQKVMVDQPSVEDTISILRGLKERFEIHHGVRITDNALIACATLSDRYISDRFLPDKAIDLMDEAAARIRTEIDSMPSELDEISRKIMQLEIEKQALSKETDKGSKARLAALEKSLQPSKMRTPPCAPSGRPRSRLFPKSRAQSSRSRKSATRWRRPKEITTWRPWPNSNTAPCLNWKRSWRPKRKKPQKITAAGCSKKK